MTSVTVTGSGNAVTSASYNSSTRQLTLTKESSFMPSAPTSIELNSSGSLLGYGGFIDFHYHDANGNPRDSSGNVVSGVVDYSSRIIEGSPGSISINGAIFKAGSVTASSFVKSDSSDSYVLLGGGGTKALSDFATADIGDDYLPLAGGTMTGAIVLPENKMSLKLRTHTSYETGLVYGTDQNEAVTLAIQNPVTAFQIVYGTKPSEFSSGT